MFYRKPRGSLDPKQRTKQHKILEKIIESFSKGIPVISTSIGAEGLDCITDYNVVIADTDIEFVDSLRKMSDETFRKKIASNARKTFEEKYSLEAYISSFNDSFKAMILKK